MRRRKKADNPEEVKRALVISNISTRCFGEMKKRLKGDPLELGGQETKREPEGECHCGFRIDAEVWLGKVIFKLVKDRVHLNIIAFELSPQTGQLEERYNIKLEDDYTEE